MPKVKERGKKKPVKPKDLPDLSSDEDHPTPSVDVPIITSTPVERSPAEPPAEPPAKKEKKTRQLTVEEEDNMAEWLKMNPCLYNKKLEIYRNTDIKRLWEDKAAEFSNVDVEYLLNWYKSMRTRYGKLSKLPTRSGAQELTERDVGIPGKFAWLKSHISRQPGRQLGGVSIKNQSELSIIDIKNCM